MFYKMIEVACNRWYSSSECTVKPIVDYIENKGKMRDAQIAAIKTYLYLKIACEGKPLADLFQLGVFNSLELNNIELTTLTRQYLESTPAAAALFEYAHLKNEKGEQVSERVQKVIKENQEQIDYAQFFRDAFYGASYTDYLFSLPMGAGKTFLMAAFIYLDLYFAKNEPQNPTFAHNFIIFAPSGLKSSVVPSLKTIQRFDPTWILPQPAASDIKRIITFEILDQDKTTTKSNKTKNPNVQKIAIHQPLSELFGLVAVTNAEKVILDRVQVENGQLKLFEETADEKDRQANELRNLIGKLPSLAIFIDEVHHAVNEEIKLRAVVNKWAENKTINSVIGFSGTPYLEKSEKISVTRKLSLATAEIANIVYYYPLINGVGNFLKRPSIKIDSAVSKLLVENGVRGFLDKYKDTVYDDDLVAKLGIYCGSIEKLEEQIYPLVSDIAAKYGISSDSILKFHKGNKKYPQPADSQLQFDSLDTSLSRIRIILLVQIGKEGWDCRSLTGVILSQESNCPKNMVLQTSCRCLRQVEKGQPETALICLNTDNAEILKSQLEKQHHISIKEFERGKINSVKLHRYDRTSYLKLPQIEFYQFKIRYDNLLIEEANPEKHIPQAADSAKRSTGMTEVTDISFQTREIDIDTTERGTIQATFSSWLYSIARESFGTLSMKQLMEYQAQLKTIFNIITYKKGDARYYSSGYDTAKVNANIRKAFSGTRDFTYNEELVSQKSSLLNIANLIPEVQTHKPDDYYPQQTIVENIILDDIGELNIDTSTETPNWRKDKERSYHYLPYHTDSNFEQVVLKEILALEIMQKHHLEIYYNGERALTEFKIKCYKKKGDRWSYLGFYTPDFLIIQRMDGQIHKAVIVETKGNIYANDPIFRNKRKFMEEYFPKRNNKVFGYKRFDYLYLEDTMSRKDRILTAHTKISEFFGGNNNAN